MKGRVLYGIISVAVIAVIVGFTYFKTGANQQASVGTLPAKPVIGPITTNPNDPGWKRLCMDRKPHIQVLSPNGGEVYQAGQQIMVKWRSCNISGNVSEINLTTTRDNGWGPGSGPNAGKFTFITNTANDGQETVILPDNASFASAGTSFGSNFKIEIVAFRVPTLVSDTSNNLFTINTNTVDPWMATCSDGKPHIQVLSPNGGETYTVGQQVPVKWRSCNGRSDDTARISLEAYIDTSAYATQIVSVPEQPGLYTITIPATIGSMRIVSGKFYKIDVEYVDNLNGNVYSVDSSDDLFSINTGIQNPKKDVITSVN